VIADLVGMVVQPGDLVLDSFGGSGTTAHAVLRLNQQLEEPLRFILIEMDEDVARNKTRARVQKAIEGYTPLTGKKRAPVEGTGGGFQFCRLSADVVFAANGKVRRDVNFAQLAEFVWFLETGTGFGGNADSPLLGVYQGRAVYLLYNGILTDKSVKGGNVLTAAVFDTLPRFAGPKVIYAAGNRMRPRAELEGITVKQTPYQIKV